MRKLIVPPIRYHAGQRKLLAEKARFNVAAMGRRWGKTTFGIEQALFEPGGASWGHPVGWFAPTYRLMLEVWDHVETTMGPVIKSSNRSTGRIAFRTGGHLDFWTLEDPDAGRGRKYRRVIIDEAAMARLLKRAWEQAILPTLADLEGDAWFISSPKGFNYFHDLFQQGQPDSATYNPHWRSWRLPTRTNPYIKDSEIELHRSILPSIVFSQEYLAEFVVMGAGLVKPEHLLIGEPLIGGRADPHGPTWNIGLGGDLAISVKTEADYTALVSSTRNPESGLLYIFDAERGHWSFHETQRRIIAKHQQFRHGAIGLESVQYQAAAVQELVRTTNLPVFGVTPDRDKITRYLPIVAKYEQGMVRHSADLPDWYGKEVLAFPQQGEGYYDDGIDATVHSLLAQDLCNSGYAGAWGGKRT